VQLADMGRIQARAAHNGDPAALRRHAGARRNSKAEFSLTVADSSYDTTAARPGPGWMGEQGTRDRAFRAARRHSLLVRLLRIVLPISGLLALAALFVVSWVSAPAPYEITVADKYISLDGIVMDRPTLTGFDKSNRRYKVSASQAVQNITTPSQVRLSDISAEVTLPDKGSATITAGGGDYDNSRDTLKLIGGIQVESTLGYRVSMKNAEVNLQSGTLTSTNPVTIRYQDSEITGDTISVSDGGKVIVLEGRIQSSLMPPKRPKGENATTKPDTNGKTGAEKSAVPVSNPIGDLIKRVEP
jgi:lipopolysaccharide export system protein LptC